MFSQNLKAQSQTRIFDPACISSQLAPVYPEGQKHVYLSALSLLIHVPPLRHGLSRHSFLSSQPLPSGVTLCPRGHLVVGLVNNVSFILVELVKLLLFIKNCIHAKSDFLRENYVFPKFVLVSVPPKCTKKIPHMCAKNK